MAEAITLHKGLLLPLHKGLLLALHNQIEDLHIEGHNLLVIDAVKNIWQAPLQIHLIVEDIKALLRQFKSYTIKHIYREAKQTG